MDAYEIRYNLVTAAHTRVAVSREEPHQFYEASLEYWDDQIDDWAKKLVAVLDS